jgi:hypothetical protein
MYALNRYCVLTIGLYLPLMMCGMDSDNAIVVSYKELLDELGIEKTNLLKQNKSLLNGLLAIELHDSDALVKYVSTQTKIDRENLFEAARWLTKISNNSTPQVKTIIGFFGLNNTVPIASVLVGDRKRFISHSVYPFEIEGIAGGMYTARLFGAHDGTIGLVTRKNAYQLDTQRPNGLAMIKQDMSEDERGLAWGYTDVSKVGSSKVNPYISNTIKEKSLLKNRYPLYHSCVGNTFSVLDTSGVVQCVSPHGDQVFYEEERDATPIIRTRNDDAILGALELKNGAIAVARRFPDKATVMIYHHCQKPHPVFKKTLNDERYWNSVQSSLSRCWAMPVYLKTFSFVPLSDSSFAYRVGDAISLVHTAAQDGTFTVHETPNVQKGDHCIDAGNGYFFAVKNSRIDKYGTCHIEDEEWLLCGPDGSSRQMVMVPSLESAFKQYAQAMKQQGNPNASLLESKVEFVNKEGTECQVSVNKDGSSFACVQWLKDTPACNLVHLFKAVPELPRNILEAYLITSPDKHNARMLRDRLLACENSLSKEKASYAFEDGAEQELYYHFPQVVKDDVEKVVMLQK